jgi:two-component system response regulator AtoC
LREQVEAFERSLIARALAAAHGNQSEAARRLGTSRPTLIDKIKKYGLG